MTERDTGSVLKTAGYLIGGTALGAAGVAEINFIQKKFEGQIEKICDCPNNPQAFTELSSYYEDYWIFPSVPGVASLAIGGALIITGVLEAIKFRRRIFNPRSLR